MVLLDSVSRRSGAVTDPGSWTATQKGGPPVPGLRAGGDVLRRHDGRSSGAGCCFHSLVLRAVEVLSTARWCFCSALALLVAQVLADHHDPTVAADHLALVADLLDARLNLHLPAVFRSRTCSRAPRRARDDQELGWVIGSWCLALVPARAPARAGTCGPDLVLSGSGRRSDRGSGHRARARPPHGPPGGS